MKIMRFIVIAALVVFGGLTVFLTSSVLLDLFGIRQKEGNFVPFIVQTNLLCGVLYLLGAYGLFTFKKWTSLLLGLTALILIGAFVALKMHINSGGIYETGTVNGMMFRIGFTVFSALAAYFIILKNKHT